MNKLILLIIIVLASVTRLIPHPPNFTPIISIGLFSGAYITNRSLAVFIPLAAMFLADLFLGFHETIYFVYGSLLLVVVLGMILLNKVSIRNCAVATLSGSFLFFVVTNFGVWFSSGYYPNNIEGMITCYVLALPFFGNTMASSLFYSVVIFGGYELLKRSIFNSTSESL